MSTPSPSIPLEAELTLFRNKLSGFKRRKSRRFRCHLATIGRVQFPDKDVSFDAFVYNLSEGGIGLNMPQALEIGQEIFVRIRITGQAEPSRFHARVMHATEEVDRTWRVGCAFTQPIGQEVLDKILE
jgi:Tfp pilus assembly protein PilZ